VKEANEEVERWKEEDEEEEEEEDEVPESKISAKNAGSMTSN
jgi:hypothetical protein